MVSQCGGQPQKRRKTLSGLPQLSPVRQVHGEYALTSRAMTPTLCWPDHYSASMAISRLPEDCLRWLRAIQSIVGKSKQQKNDSKCTRLGKSRTATRQKKEAAQSLASGLGFTTVQTMTALGFTSPHVVSRHDTALLGFTARVRPRQ